MIKKLNYYIHHHLLKLLLLIYLVAAIFPKFGIGIKNTSLGQVHWDQGGSVIFSLPLLMLSFLLLNAGLSVQFTSLKKVIKVPTPLIIGLLSNLLIPLAFTLIFALFGKLFWHNPDEIQNVLVGLAIIASMPIAGSSTAWVQNANGNPALILGLVVVSTIFSPLLSPLVFHTVGFITTGDYSEDLHELANQGASLFLIISVVVPSLLGIAIRSLINDRVWSKVFPILKMANLINLLALNYSNASASLPTAFKSWDLDFLGMILFSTGILCILSFSAGWLIPKILKIPHPERIALTYGLGMNNNGTGLVLASATLADHPLVMLPIIFYNLGQQIIAGIFDRKIVKSSEKKER